MVNQETADIGAAVAATRSSLRTRQILTAAIAAMEREGSGAVSMHTLAREAGVSVGLVYKYFASKQEIIVAIISEVLQAFEDQIPGVLADLDDPVEQLVAAFGTYCRVIDEHRQATLLTYRETRNLDDAARTSIKNWEIDTVEPLRQATRKATESGLLNPVDVDLFAYNLLLLAHAWALKHWYFDRTFTLDEYISKQATSVIAPTLTSRYRKRYAHLFN